MSTRLSSAAFHQAADRLRVPGMGTEVVAPLLANLIQLTRPRRVLEVGMGYTTPFLAAALADNADAVRAEAARLAEKTRRYAEDGRELDEAWLLADPPLAVPAFHDEPYEPRLVVVDDLSDAESSAASALPVLRELGLDDLVTVVHADLHTAADRIPADCAPIDFAWVDAWECLRFFDEFMPLVNPDGGVIAMHYLMTYPEGEAVLRYIERYHRAHPGELEVLSLLEPHKLAQNSITLLSRTGGRSPRRYAGPGGAIPYAGLREDALAQARTAATGSR